MGESHERVEQKKPETKEYILCDSVYIKKKNRKTYLCYYKSGQWLSLMRNRD